MKNKIQVLMFSLIVILFTSLLLGNVVFTIFLSVLMITVLVSHFINAKVRLKIPIELSVFSLDPTLPRNFDYLIIGDNCNLDDIVPKNSSSIYFVSPDRTL
uniref:hypothetical protein n=1 Tax=Pseudoalteromonas sp. c7(2019) TaxID=2687287 RepID=UPI00197ED05A